MTNLLTNSDFLESLWSGGSTTQLYIFPEDASYTERNFQFRISTAKVEVAETTFTSLPGFSRKLMILEGEITIHHENHYSKQLAPFEVDSFSGDWTTTALGTCVDFNVMTSVKMESDLSTLELHRHKKIELSADQKWEHLFFYSVEGEAEIKMANVEIQLKKGNLLHFSELNLQPIQLQTSKKARIVLVRIAG